MLDLERDPKLAWALRNRGLFPVDVNRAPRETLLRIPGIGVRVVTRILNARRHVTLRLDDLQRLVHSLEAVRPFVVTPDWRPTALIDSASLGSAACVPRRRVSPICSRERTSAVQVVRLQDEVDFEGFRAAARSAAARGVRPEAIRFLAGCDGEDDLLAEPDGFVSAETTRTSPSRVPRRFVEMADWCAAIATPPATTCSTPRPASPARQCRAFSRSRATRWCGGWKAWSEPCGATATR